MNWLRWTFTAVTVLALALVAGRSGEASFITQQRDQIAVVILVNVTPAPLAYTAPRTEAPAQISARMQLRARGSGGLVDVPNFRIGPNTVAQAQSALRVQAEVSPNPNATMLVSSQPAVVFNQVAGTTATTPACVYTITVDTPSTTSWKLDDGLSSDFITGTWPGGDLANNTYQQGATPQPTATPFVVFSSNNTFFTRVSSTGLKTYCVTLTLTIPSSVPAGAYSTNAVYTLFF